VLVFPFSIARLIRSFHNNVLPKYSPIKLFVKQIKPHTKTKKVYARTKKECKVMEYEHKNMLITCG